MRGGSEGQSRIALVKGPIRPRVRTPALEKDPIEHLPLGKGDRRCVQGPHLKRER